LLIGILVWEDLKTSCHFYNYPERRCKMILKRLGILSLGYTTAIFAFIMGVLQVLLLALQIKLMPSALDPAVVSAISTNVVKFYILTPIMAILIGFIGGVIGALIYNYIVVRLTGGIKLELK